MNAIYRFVKDNEIRDIRKIRFTVQQFDEAVKWCLEKHLGQPLIGLRVELDEFGDIEDGVTAMFLEIELGNQYDDALFIEKISTLLEVISSQREDENKIMAFETEEILSLMFGDNLTPSTEIVLVPDFSDYKKYYEIIIKTTIDLTLIDDLIEMNKEVPIEALNSIRQKNDIECVLQYKFQELEDLINKVLSRLTESRTDTLLEFDGDTGELLLYFPEFETDQMSDEKLNKLCSLDIDPEDPRESAKRLLSMLFSISFYDVDCYLDVSYEAPKTERLIPVKMSREHYNNLTALL